MESNTKIINKTGWKIVSKEEATGWRRKENYCDFWLKYKAMHKKKRVPSGQSCNSLRNKVNNVRTELLPKQSSKYPRVYTDINT